MNIARLREAVLSRKWQLLTALGVFAFALVFGNEAGEAAPVLLIGAMDDFGEAFAMKTVRRFYQNAVTPAITNSN